MLVLASLLLAAPCALAVALDPSFAARQALSPSQASAAQSVRYLAACNTVKQQLGAGAVTFAATPEYINGTKHYSSAGQKVPACVAFPSSAEQVGKILRVVDQTKTPFAVQSGGHGVQPGFSSTEGIHISLSKLKQIEISTDGLTVDVGAGNLWGEVYTALQPRGRTAVGGRVPIVGVGGFLAYGGGYSFHSNQYGLGVDNVQEYTLVLPTGTVTRVSARLNNKLFNALKGTGNNFGIITSFKLKTVPLPPKVWGGTLMLTPDAIPALDAWLANFSNTNKDAKAVALPSYNYVAAQNTVLVSVQLFYDGPTPPAGIFDAILAIPSLPIDPGFGTRTFTDMMYAVPADAFAGSRNLFHTVPVKSYSSGFIDHYSQLVSQVAAQSTGHPLVLIQGVIEPFLPSVFTFASGKEAFAHGKANACLPTCIALAWASPADDAYFFDTARSMAADLTAFAKAEGQDLDDCPLYPNYSLGDTPLDKIYIDAARLAELRAYRQQIDPRNVMRLAGGFKL